MGAFQHERTIPALPIADLKETCGNLKKMMKPVVDNEVWQEACKSLDAFASDGGEGQTLQKLLTDWKESQSLNHSWLRPIWDDIYLGFRDRLPVNMNYCFKLLQERWEGDSLPVFIAALCQRIREMRTESLEPEASRTGYFSMDTLENMIYTRIPSAVKATLQYPPLSAPATVSVVCKGHWFILTLEDEEGKLLSVSSIKKALDDIRTQAAALPKPGRIGSITCAKQDEAFRMRILAQEKAINRLNLTSLENTLFTVCLDEAPEKEEDFAYHLLCYDPANRWSDKSLQIISGGSYLGVNIEHTGCDAGIWVYLLGQVDQLIMENRSELEKNNSPAHIRRLKWIITPELKTEIQKNTKEYCLLTQSLSVQQRRFHSISKDVIKEKKCSPDAFVQLLYQTAYFKITGKFRSVYEAVSTRNFYQGRTECVRPCTIESTDFIKAFCGGESKERLQELFRIAESAHRREIGNCQKAFGPQRHMSGLSAMADMYAGTSKYEGDNPPAVFNTEGYKTLCHDALSTSSIAAPYIDFFGFGPVVSDGMGIGYGVRKEALHLMVASYDDSGVKPEIFFDEIEETAKAFLDIL